MSHFCSEASSCRSQSREEKGNPTACKEIKLRNPKLAAGKRSEKSQDQLSGARRPWHLLQKSSFANLNKGERLKKTKKPSFVTWKC